MLKDLEFERFAINDITANFSPNRLHVLGIREAPELCGKRKSCESPLSGNFGTINLQNPSSTL